MKGTFKAIKCILNYYSFLEPISVYFSHSKIVNIFWGIELMGDKSVDLLGQIKLKLEIYVSKFKLKAILILLDT